MIELFSNIDYDKFYDEIGKEVGDLKEDVINSAKKEKKNSKEKWPPTDSFGWIKLSKTKTYSVPGVEERLKKTKDGATNPQYKNALVMTQKGRTYRANHHETYYTDRSRFFPVRNIEWRIRSVLNRDRERASLPKIPEGQRVWQYADDGTIRDMNGYIIIAANLSTYPRGTLVMTTLGPGRVYDTGKLSANHIDVYTHR